MKRFPFQSSHNPEKSFRILNDPSQEIPTHNVFIISSKYNMDWYKYALEIDEYAYLEQLKTEPYNYMLIVNPSKTKQIFDLLTQYGYIYNGNDEQFITKSLIPEQPSSSFQYLSPPSSPKRIFPNIFPSPRLPSPSQSRSPSPERRSLDFVPFFPSPPLSSPLLLQVPPSAPSRPISAFAPQLAPIALSFEETNEMNQISPVFTIKIGRTIHKLNIQIYLDIDPKFYKVQLFLNKCFEEELGYTTPSIAYAIVEYYDIIAASIFTKNLTNLPFEYQNPNSVYLYNVCTKKNYRGFHLQERLLLYAFLDLKEKNINTVYLLVHTDNTSAITLYNRLKFIKIKTIMYYNVPSDLMYLNL